MRIAEEANRRRIRIKTELSNRFNLYVSGENFRVQVNFGEKTKWKVNVAAVWEHDPGSNTPITDWLATAEGSDEIQRFKGEKITPYCAVWVADLLESIIIETPGKNCTQSILTIYFNNILIIISLMIRSINEVFEENVGTIRVPLHLH